MKWISSKKSKKYAENSINSEIVKDKKRKSIKTKLMSIVFLLLLIPILSNTIVAYYIDSKEIKTRAEETNKNIGDSIATQIDIYIQSVMNTMQLLASTNDFTEMDRYEMEDVFKRYAYQNKDFIGFQYIDLNGNVIVSNLGSKDGNVSEMDWFKNAKSGKLFISQSIKADKGSQVGMMISVPISNKFSARAGVLAVMVGMNQINELVKNVTIGEDGYAYAIDENGYVVGHRLTTEYVLGRYNVFYGSSEDVKKVGKSEYDVVYGVNNQLERSLITGSKVRTNNWRVIVEQNEDEILSQTRVSLKRSLIIAAILLVLSLIVTYIFATVFTRPITKLVDSAMKIKDGDLTERIDVTADNEIGQLQEAFNEMTISIGNILSEINKTTGEVNSFILDLNDNIEVSSKASMEISQAIESMASDTTHQMNSVEGTATAISNMVNEIDEMTERYNVVVKASEAASSLAQNGAQSIKNIQDMMVNITNASSTTSTLIQNLDKHTQNIGMAGQLITQISEQTNLLALNAAIEAARAGEHGRGFAVVADEVRKLAEQSKVASSEIISLINSIQVETRKAVEVIDQGAEGVKQGNLVTDKAAISFNEIVEKTNESTEAMRSLSANIDKIFQGVAIVENTITEVSGVAQATAAGAEEVLASTEEQASVIQHMSTSADTLSQMAQGLKGLVNRFKISDIEDEVSMTYLTDEDSQFVVEYEQDNLNTDDDFTYDIQKEEILVDSITTNNKEIIQDLEDEYKEVAFTEIVEDKADKYGEIVEECILEDEKIEDNIPEYEEKIVE